MLWIAIGTAVAVVVGVRVFVVFLLPRFQRAPTMGELSIVLRALPSGQSLLASEVQENIQRQYGYDEEQFPLKFVTTVLDCLERDGSVKAMWPYRGSKLKKYENLATVSPDTPPLQLDPSN